MPESRKLNDYKSVLIVEGYSDLLFFAECLEHVGKHEMTFIQPFNGKEDLIAKLESFINPQLLAEKTSIAIIVDANGASGAVFGKVQKALLELTGQTVPNAGSWTEGSPKIGIFIAPDNVNNGEIETLVWSAWCGDEANSASVKCIETFIGCMHTDAGFQVQSREKGRVHALLAVRNDDDPRLGPGTRARVFDLKRPEFTRLLEFLSGF
jgi:hypothetical protein